jgi:hypothetical protein
VLVLVAVWVDVLPVDGVVLLPLALAEALEAGFFAAAVPDDDAALDEELGLPEAVLGALVVCGASVEVADWAQASFAEVMLAKIRPAKMKPERSFVLTETNTAVRRTKVLPTDGN